jgi:hypothetical protein
MKTAKYITVCVLLSCCCWWFAAVNRGRWYVVWVGRDPHFILLVLVRNNIKELTFDIDMTSMTKHS